MHASDAPEHPGGSTTREQGPGAGLLRQRRRLMLETRTLITSLQSALTDLEESRDTSVDDRARIRLAWCEQVRVPLQAIRARAMQLDALLQTVDLGPDVAPPGTTYLDDAEARLRQLEGAVA